MSMGLSERREILERSGLCLFCLKHAAELECYGRGGLSKPKCTQAGCDGEHTPNVHRLMGEESAGVNLVAEDESEMDEDKDEDEGEEWWVGTIGVMGVQDEGEGSLEKGGEPEPNEETRPITSGCGGGNDSGLGGEPEYPIDTHSSKELEEDGWWSPGLSQSSSEEDEGEAHHPVRVRSPKPRGKKPTLGGAVGSPEDATTAPGRPQREWAPHPESAKRRKLRKKTERTRDQEWEKARQDAWLRGMLSDTSGSEDGESCGRFAESGRWAFELFKIPQHPATTSGGECSRQKTAGCS
jgi:hypothetical protein